MTAKSGLPVDKEYASAGLRGLNARGQSRGSAADDAHLGMEVLHLGSYFGHGMDIDRPQAGDSPSHGLEQPPLPRFVELFVIKADGKSPVKLIDNPEQVEAKRRPGVLMADDLAFAGRLDANPHVRPAIHLHEAVGAFPGYAKQAARSMVLEAAAENSNAGVIQRGADCLPRQSGYRFAVESKSERLAGINQQSGLVRHNR